MHELDFSGLRGLLWVSNRCTFLKAAIGQSENFGLEMFLGWRLLLEIAILGASCCLHFNPCFSVLFSMQATPGVELSDEEIESLTKRTQDGGTEVVQAKAGKGSATLSMA